MQAATNKLQVWRPNAPFRQYAETDDSVYADGLKNGLEWPAHWNHLPGGPYFARDYRKTEEEWLRHPSDNWHADWFAYCRLLEHHNKVWLDGWYEGFRRAAKKDPAIRRMRTKLLIEKLGK